MRNLRGGVRLQGRDRAGTAEVISDEARMREAYRIILAATPGYARALGVSLRSDGLPRREDVARISQKGHVVGPNRARFTVPPVHGGAWPSFTQ